MSELSDLLLPKLASEQRAAIARASGAFALWRVCPRGACRRAHACRGLVETLVPECTPALAERVRETHDALMALVPPSRRGPVQAVQRQLLRIAQRMAALAEREVGEMERRAGARPARDGSPAGQI